MTGGEFSMRNVKTLVWCLLSAFLFGLAFLAIAKYPLLPSGSSLWWWLLLPAVSLQVLMLLLYKWQSPCMVLCTWCKAICSQRETSVNFVSHSFSGTEATAKISHSHKKLEHSQKSPWSQLILVPIVYFISFWVTLITRAYYFFKLNVEEENLFFASIFIPQWKAVSNRKPLISNCSPLSESRN